MCAQPLLGAPLLVEGLFQLLTSLQRGHESADV